MESPGDEPAQFITEARPKENKKHKTEKASASVPEFAEIEGFPTDTESADAKVSEVNIEEFIANEKPFFNLFYDQTPFVMKTSLRE